MEVRMSFWMLLVLLQRLLTGPLGKAETEQDTNDFIPVRSGGPARHTRSASHHPLKDMPCAESVDHHPDALREVLLALKNVWSSKDGVPGKRELNRFGICLDSRDDPQFSSLMNNIMQEENGSLEYVHSKIEHWHVEEDGRFTLTLHFVNPGSCSQQTTPASMLLMFFIDSCNTDEMKIEFSARVLQPNNQTVCVSQATRFLVLQTDLFSPGHIKLRMSVRSDGKVISLAELKTIVYQRNGRSKSPVVVLFPKISAHENVPRSNQTFLFLCELQKLLNDVSPPENPLLVPDNIQTVSPSVLHSLPPLTLGVSSSESLLLELVNSSGPTVFYFPQSVLLRSHRVELELKPSLVSVLKSRLDDALARVRSEEFGYGVVHKLQILSVLSTLPEEPETGTENQREVQYRALLLLKALQAMLDAWALDRAQRAARAGQEGQARLTQCHLESFTVSLEKYLLEPATANINNCEGVCGFPLTNGNNHAILLNSHLQSGQPLNRTLCCVPVTYDDLCVIELHSDTTTISYKTDMVAKECGCR